ncbi:MAG TPA: trypsin-like peptidase domain-containing protein [Candidatus Saccharimonadia bacterium]|nr:trypsin-like peptidase domain-containing protein [Candidatus Saccharimonadia bacterium]
MSEIESTEKLEPDVEPVALPVQAASAIKHQMGSMGMPQRVAVVALLFGLAGGAFGSYVFIRYFATSIPVTSREAVVQEASAYINVAKSVSPAVVSITSQSVTQGFFGEPEQTSAAGTGMIVNSDGLILTNRHVVDDSTASYTVVLNNGKSYPAKVVSLDSNNDLAFVRISASGLPTVKLGDSSSVQVGQQVVAIGNALGQFQNSVTQGIISGLSREVEAGDSSSGGLSTSTSGDESLQDLFQTDAAINPGNSGGPLVNLAGQVVGIDTAIAGQGSQNIGFAIPINDAKALVSSVENTGTIQTAYLGVRYVALDPTTAQANNLSVSQGAWVQAADSSDPGVVSGSPADKAGIKDGDVITKVGGANVNETSSLQSLVEAHKPGDKVAFTINRGGKSMTIEVTLGQTPAGQ